MSTISTGFRPADEPAAPNLAESLRTLGDYRLIREVGRGGMGVVYEAEQLSLGRRVALKILPFAAVLDPRHLQRFKNEALAAAHLDHPNIVEVYGVGCERGVHFYAMRYVEGQTLAAVVEGMRKGECGMRNDRSDHAQTVNDSVLGTQYSVPADESATAASQSALTHSPFPTRHSPLADTSPIAALSTLRPEKPAEFFRTIAELGIQAAEALDHAHQMGVVHRDIKPSNLMIETGSGVFFRPAIGQALLDVAGRPEKDSRPFSASTPRLFITDFGLAHIDTGASLTMTGNLVGTVSRNLRKLN